MLILELLDLFKPLIVVVLSSGVCMELIPAILKLI